MSGLINLTMNKLTTSLLKLDSDGDIVKSKMRLFNIS